MQGYRLNAVEYYNENSEELFQVMNEVLELSMISSEFGIISITEVLPGFGRYEWSKIFYEKGIFYVAEGVKDHLIGKFLENQIIVEKSPLRQFLMYIIKEGLLMIKDNDPGFLIMEMMASLFPEPIFGKVLERLNEDINSRPARPVFLKAFDETKKYKTEINSMEVSRMQMMLSSGEYGNRVCGILSDEDLALLLLTMPARNRISVFRSISQERLRSVTEKMIRQGESEAIPDQELLIKFESICEGL